MRSLSVMIKPVSGACNMRCKYCFYADVMANREIKVYPRMTLETLEIIVRRACLYADGPISFAFQGGEPTLIGLPFFQAFVRFVKQYRSGNQNVQYAVQTNGYDLSDELISFFAREHFLLGISLDGIEETHDKMRLDMMDMPTYKRVLSTLERLGKAGVEHNVLCVVNRYVAQHPREVFKALAPHRYIQFIPCLDELNGDRREYSLSDKDYLAFQKYTFDLYYKAFMAGQPISVRNFDNYVGLLLGMPPENCAMKGQCAENFLIESDGSVYPCDFYVLDKWKLGNIQDMSYNKLTHSETALRFRAEPTHVPEECKHCHWFFYCRNGCKRERDPETGKSKWCKQNQQFFEYAHPKLKELAKEIQRREKTKNSCRRI